MKIETVSGFPTALLDTQTVQFGVTLKGGHLWPVEFKFGDETFTPLHIAPWTEEGIEDLPPIIEVLRGDFFCAPFGGNATPFEESQFPIHGETANEVWSLSSEDTSEALELSLITKIRPMRITKRISVRTGHHAIYQEHDVDGQGPMSFGHHAMLAFPEGVEGRISTSAIRYGQVFPSEFESPRVGGYTSLKQGARFSSLSEVPLATGGTTDLTTYPAREGFEDLVQVYAAPSATPAWTACVFSNGYVWISLRDPRTLTGTVMWHSNGGRHYSPWNGRHRRVIGLEDVTSFFHTGIAESVAPNEASNEGIKTFLEMPFTVRTIMVAGQVSTDFGIVESIEPSGNGICVQGRDGNKVELAVDLSFLKLND